MAFALRDGCPPVIRFIGGSTKRRDGYMIAIGVDTQLGHAHLGITSSYLRGIDNTEIIHTVHQRPAPMIPASTSLRQGA